MTARYLLLRIQRALFDKLAKHSLDILGTVPKPLEKYAREYEREFTAFQRISSGSELVDAFLQTDVIFWGDYHTLPQAQNTLVLTLRLSLGKLRKRGRPVVLALEMLRPRDEGPLKQYLEGRLSESRLLRKIGYMRNWGFPWENYRALLDLAGAEGWEVRGLAGAEKGPRRRDTRIARRLAKRLKAKDRPIAIVLIGDHHLASGHLPQELRKALSPQAAKFPILRVLQNIDPFYWKLLEQGKIQGVEVVKISPETYCIINSPPWVKLQSHLSWNEVCSQLHQSKPSASPLSPLKKIEIALRELDHSDEFQDYVESLSEALGTPLDSEDFMLYGPGELSFLERMVGQKAWPAKNIRQLEKYLKTFKAFFVPRENIIYFRTFNHGQLTAQAAFYVHSKLGGYDRIFADPASDLFRFAWIESLGFLGSKLLNSKRRCPNLDELRALTAASDPRREQKIVTATLNILEKTGRTFSPNLSPKLSSVEAYKVSKFLGHRLGERLYFSLMGGKLSIKEVKQRFTKNYLKLSPSQAYTEYREWGEKLADVP